MARLAAIAQYGYGSGMRIHEPRKLLPLVTAVYGV